MFINDVLRYLHTTPIEEVKERTAKLEGYIEELKVDAYAYKDSGDIDAFIETFKDIEENQKLYRIMRGYFDVLFFAYEYFSDMQNPENETNLIPTGSLETAPTFHKELCAKLNELNTVNPTKKIGWGAPRGSGKSAYLSNVEPTHAIVYRTRKYILIISETFSMSQSFLEFISTNLKSNAKLRADFGELLSLNSKQNLEDNKESFVTFTETKVQASSMGGQLRGSRFKNVRPDLIICDDLESARNTNTQDLRDKNLHWFNSVIEPIGDPKRTSFIYMGTLVHGQGLLPNILKRPEYDSKIYSSIVNEPDRADLWEKLDTMLRETDNPNRLIEAENFYYKNKAEMDAGVQVLWADRFSYLDLMKKKVDVGSRAFASEYLNLPSDSESAIFREEYFNHFEREELFNGNTPRANLDVYGFWDIAMGKNSRSDYNAIVVIGRDRRTGVVYVLEAWAKKCPPHEAMEKVLEYVEYYRPKTFGIETINAQFEFYRQVQQQAVKKGLYFTRFKPVNPTAKKEQRIEALEPLFEQGYIKTQKHHRLLEEMLLQYPSHPHDDLPDCLASALSLTRLVKARAYFDKPTGI